MKKLILVLMISMNTGLALAQGGTIGSDEINLSKSCQRIIEKSNGETPLTFTARQACLEIPNSKSAQEAIDKVKNESDQNRKFVLRKLAYIIAVSSLLESGVAADKIEFSSESFLGRAGDNGLLMYLPHLFKEIGFESTHVDHRMIGKLRLMLNGDDSNSNSIYVLTDILADLEIH